MAMKTSGGSASPGIRIPDVPDRRNIALRYAVCSHEHVVLQAREQLLIVTELAHGEEIGKEFRARVEDRERAIRAHEEAQKRMKLRMEIEQQMMQSRAATRPALKRDWQEDERPSGPRKSFIRWFLGG